MKKLKNTMSAGAAGPARQLTLLSLGLLASLAHAQGALEAGVIAGQTGGAIVAQTERPKQKAKVAPKSKKAATATTAATTAAAPKARTMEGPNCSGDAILPQKLVLPIGKSTLVRLPEAVDNRTIGNPDIVKAMLVSPHTMYLLGVDVGMTNMIIQGKSGTCSAIDIVVTMDPGGLQNTLAQLLPEEKNIQVSAAADSLVLTGTVSDATAVAVLWNWPLPSCAGRRPRCRRRAGCRGIGRWRATGGCGASRPAASRAWSTCSMSARRSR